jgi:hypothetical protein
MPTTLLFTRQLQLTLIGLVVFCLLFLRAERRNSCLNSTFQNSSLRYFPPGNTTRPALSELLALTSRPSESLEVNNINASSTNTAALQSILDFSIIGHPKTATTFLLEWLYQQPEIQAYSDEIYSLQQGNLTEFVELMYNLPAGANYKRGYKAPRDVCSPQVLHVYQEYFPKTKLIVGLRHPVLWFESFYNYRMRKNTILPPADSPLFIEQCSESLHGVCTDESLFHYHLALLGKVNISSPSLAGSPAHQDLFSRTHYERLLQNNVAVPNPVFLYDMQQLHDANTTRAHEFRQDLSRFLEHKRPLTYWEREKSTRVKLKVLNICDDRYGRLRTALMENAKAASTWIRTYFMTSEGVTVSSPEYFEFLLMEWMVDPCLERNAKTRVQK